MGTPQQRPLELILARNLLSNLATPAALTNAPGDIVFYNAAAGEFLGRPFEETGPVPAEAWVEDYGPLGEDGEPVPIDRERLAQTLRSSQAGHERYRIRTRDGTEHEIEVSGVPVIGPDGYHGAMIFFWAQRESAA